jgi:hypothetical protein
MLVEVRSLHLDPLPEEVNLKLRERIPTHVSLRKSKATDCHRKGLEIFIKIQDLPIRQVCKKSTA